jgi:hypothetical protein
MRADPTAKLKKAENGKNMLAGFPLYGKTAHAPSCLEIHPLIVSTMPCFAAEL